jgi:hypothetical protein
MVETKEIRVYDMPGASVGSIVTLQSKSLLIWVLLVIIIALPVAYHTLRNAGYRTLCAELILRSRAVWGGIIL